MRSPVCQTSDRSGAGAEEALGDGELQLVMVGLAFHGIHVEALSLHR